MVVNVVVMVNICMLFKIFSKPSTYIYIVKMTESDRKKAYQVRIRTVVIYFAIKVCFCQTRGRYIRCYVLLSH
jgi:hypothetical protein